MLPQTEQSPPHIPNTFSIQDWINMYITHQNKTQSRCPTCMSIWHTQAAYCHTSPFLHFEIPPDMSQHVLPSNYLQLTNINSQNISYKLKAIIYLGGFHFTARLIEENGKTWAYDSQINRGIADEDQNTI
jgi:hypothetical protein